MLRRLVPLLALLVVLLRPAAAQRNVPTEWLTTDWYVSDYDDKIPDEHAAEAWLSSHFAELSIWLRDLGFAPPRLLAAQVTATSEGPVAQRYKSWILATDPVGCAPTTLAQYVDSNNPRIEICSGTLLQDRSLLASLRGPAAWSDEDLDLLSTFAHELFHGIHDGYVPSDIDDDAFKWITEGIAEAVGHTWKATENPRFEWFHETAETQHHADYTRALTDPSDENAYGLGHFWWNVGLLLVPADQVGITVYQGTFWDQTWSGDGVAGVDAALREVAAELDAPPNARDGLYDLYPQVLAHGANATHFERVHPHAFGQPSISTIEDLLLPLSAYAARIAIDIDETQGEGQTVPVRITLGGIDPGAIDTSGRDALHLIVDGQVIGRPLHDETPYSHIVYAAEDMTLDVRVANVALKAEETVDNPFRLRVEVEGFTGTAADPPAGGSAPAAPLAGGGSSGTRRGASPAPSASGELRPGFAVRGPGAWTCSGTRAIFDVESPDERGDDAERILPEMSHDLENAMGGVEAAMRRMERAGQERILTPEEVEAMEAMGGMVGDLLEQAAAEGDVEGQADELRAESRARLRATFVDDASGCQMTVSAGLLTREAGPGIVPGASDVSLYPDGDGPGFAVGVYDREMLQMIKGERMPSLTGGPGWDACVMSSEEAAEKRRFANDCPAVTCTPGRLNLERASDGQITGTFEFEVLMWPLEPPRTGCHVPIGRDVVTGQFNVTSADDGQDDNGLSILAGTPILD